MNVEMQVMQGSSLVIEAGPITHGAAVEAIEFYNDGRGYTPVFLTMWGGHTTQLVPGPDCAWLCHVCGSEVGGGKDEGCPHCWME